MIKKLSITLTALFMLSIFACTNDNTATKTTTDTDKKVEAKKDMSHEQKTATRKMLSETEKAEYIKKGKAIAKSSFVTLSTQLKKALIKGDVNGALEYCNTKASKIQDSLSVVHHATIKRTTNKLRNKDNAPTNKEKKVLRLYESAVKNGAPLKPHVSVNPDNTVSFYAPIKVKDVCLKCHGTVGGKLSKSNYAIIKKIYKDDQATGFKEGDFRGMWSITMK